MDREQVLSIFELYKIILWQKLPGKNQDLSLQIIHFLFLRII